MKKSRNILIILCGVFILAVGILAVLYSLGETKSAGEAYSENTVSNEEYLLIHSLEKAPSAENLIFLTENTDCSFTYGDETLKAAAKDIISSFFDGVILRSSKLSLKNSAKLSEQEQNNLTLICDYFKQNGKKVYLFASAYLSQETLTKLSTLCNGVVLDISEVGSDSAQTLSSKLLTFRKSAKGKEVLLYGKTEILAGVDPSAFDRAFVSVSDEKDAESFISLFASGLAVSPVTDFSLYGQSRQPVDALKAHYALKECAAIEKRAFWSYSSVKANKDNCFGAVRTYIKNGIAPILAFRDFSIRNKSESDKLTVNEPVLTAEFSCSYLFPVYLGGKSLGIFPKSTGETRLDLVRGNNSFTFSQNGKEDCLEAEYIFEGDIIKSISPADSIRVTPGEELSVMVIAYSEAEVYVKLGAKKYPAYKQDGMTGYTAFMAKVTLPHDVTEMSSLDRIMAVASLGQQTQQLEGAKINSVVPENTFASSTSLQNNGIYEIENYIPTYIDVEQQVLPSISAAISRATTNASYTPFTGNQVAVVTADYADTKPGNSDSDYVPFYPAFAKGTTDFVIGESQSYDTDENEWYYYYDLACGMKVSRDSVVLQPATSMPENSLAVNSVYADNGELTIRLSSIWKVPYSFSLENQNYYSSNSKLYYVSDFTASAISLTFNYTTSVSGEIDCSGSDVISSAIWSVSKENRTATLYMPFIQQGSYYGYSLSYEGNETVITIKNRFKGLAGSVVVLDPGHGYDDSGATGLSGQVKESDINILVAYQAKAALEQQGVTVYMTRYGDDDINLEGRKIFARTVKPDLYVSIHSNAASNTESIGASAFYYKAFSMQLATNIYDELVYIYRNCFYPGRQELYDDIARGVKYYPFSVTRLDECPSVLIEIGFMTNDAECYMLTQSGNQQLIGQAIAKGICQTLTQ